MSLSSSQLDAFVAVAQTLNFSRAAAKLGLTQSALSQRIKNLEDELGVPLLIRAPGGASLTEPGSRLIRYCQARDMLEAELLADFKASEDHELAGAVRIGAYSSVMRPVIIEALAPLVRAHERLSCELVTRDVQDVEGLLDRAEVDIIVIDRQLKRPSLTSHQLGAETYVMIESATFATPSDVFLDTDPADVVTEDFLSRQKGPRAAYRRSFISDCHGILDGVRLGLGRAIMPRHMTSGYEGVREVAGFAPVERDVYLYYFTQPFYTKLQQAVVEQLTRLAPPLLGRGLV